MAESNGVTNPNVGGGGGGKKPPFNLEAPQGSPQPKYGGADIAGSTVDGGRFPFAQADASKANPQRAKELGAGTLGSSIKPFRVSGGG